MQIKSNFDSPEGLDFFVIFKTTSLVIAHPGESCFVFLGGVVKKYITTGAKGGRGRVTCDLYLGEGEIVGFGVGRWSAAAVGAAVTIVMTCCVCGEYGFW